MHEKKPDSSATEDHKDLIDGRSKTDKPQEIGGPKGLEPTRYGDWERKGRCIDF